MPAAVTDAQNRADREALLDTAEALFYDYGIQAVGMDQLRTAAGLPLKRIYKLFPAKEDLVVAMLRRRDRRWRASLETHVTAVADPRDRVLAVYDWLADWFTQPGFRGCAWINAYGELGSTSGPVAAEVRAHKAAFRAQLATWAADAGAQHAADALYLLAEGAIVTAGIETDPAAAADARRAADVLLPISSPR